MNEVTEYKTSFDDTHVRDPKFKLANSVDANYVKTLYNEQHPDKKRPDQPFGALIACDGYNMKNGAEFLWHTVFTQNVTRMVTLNETAGFQSKWINDGEVY